MEDKQPQPTKEDLDNYRQTDMKISKSFPPNYRAIVEALGECENAIYCYGDTIYNPHGRDITPDIEIHEQVHSRQQGPQPEIWYYKYLTDGEFRLEQEIEAYGTQWAFVKDQPIPAKIKQWAKDSMAKALSGKEYGNLINHREAEQAIRHFANNN